MMILVDTNVFSELPKPRPDERVVAWLVRHRDRTLLSTIVVAELELGIRNTPGAAKRALLEPWLAKLIGVHRDRIAAFDLPAAQRWAQFASKVLIADQHVGSRQFDTLIAAQAMALGVPLATRNSRDFAAIEVTIIDPWSG